MPPPIRVMTFNIRNSGAGDGPNAWPNRRDLFFDTVDRFGPDLLGVQEVLPDQYAALTERAGYGWAGVPRDDGVSRGERALVGYRADRFDRLDAGDFWLRDASDQPGLGWDAVCIRLCSWVRLRDRSAARDVLFANTHWDHVGTVARERSAALLRHRLLALAAGAATVLVGDLNAVEDDACVRTLVASGAGTLVDAYRSAHRDRASDEASFHGFTGVTDGSRIDFVLHGPGLRATAATIDRTAGPGGRYPSDHFAIAAVLEWASVSPTGTP